MGITPPAPDDPFGSLTSAGEERWPVPLLVVLTVVGLVVGFSRTDAPADRAQTGTEISVGSSASDDDDAAGEQGRPISYWDPPTLAAALAAMQEEAGGADRLTSLRVDADYLVAEFARGKDRMYVYAGEDGRADLQNSRIGNPGDRSVPVDAIDPAAPDRVRRRMARLAGARLENVDYLVLLQTLGNEPYWVGYLDQATDYDAQLNPFEARLDGSGVKGNGPKGRGR